jgi:hypothetical protein
VYAVCCMVYAVCCMVYGLEVPVVLVVVSMVLGVGSIVSVSRLQCILSMNANRCICMRAVCNYGILVCLVVLVWSKMLVH